MFLTGQWQIQQGFAQALRLAFKHHRQLRWDPNEAKSKIHIYDSNPLARLRYPFIIIRVMGGPAQLRGIGEEFATVSKTTVSIQGASHGVHTGIKYSGNLRPTVILQIAARSGFERAEIADWCILFLRHFAVKKFRNEGCLIQDLQMGAQTERLLGSDTVFETTVNVVCLTSFVRVIPVSTAETIDSICLTGVFTSLDGATIGDSTE